MTFKILKSQLPENFETLVAEYLEAKLHHRFTVNKPAPTAPPEVTACVTRVPGAKDQPDDFILDYDVINDDPSLKSKKLALLGQVSDIEVELTSQISPPAKLRLQTLQYQDALAAASTRPLTSDEDQFVKDVDARKARLDAIYRKVAEIHAEIDDLTEETIGSWSMKPLE